MSLVKRQFRMVLLVSLAWQFVLTQHRNLGVSIYNLQQVLRLLNVECEVRGLTGEDFVIVLHNQAHVRIFSSKLSFYWFLMVSFFQRRNNPCTYFALLPQNQRERIFTHLVGVVFIFDASGVIQAVYDQLEQRLDLLRPVQIQQREIPSQPTNSTSVSPQRDTDRIPRETAAYAVSTAYTKTATGTLHERETLVTESLNPTYIPGGYSRRVNPRISKQVVIPTGIYLEGKRLINPYPILQRFGSIIAIHRRSITLLLHNGAECVEKGAGYTITYKGLALRVHYNLAQFSKASAILA